MIYSDLARVLRDARGYASSVTQLRMIDKIVYMVADCLADYKNFNEEHFLKYTDVGSGVPLFDKIGESNE